MAVAARASRAAAAAADAVKFFYHYPQAENNKVAVEVAIEAKLNWQDCVSKKVEQWKSLDEPTKTILDTAFYKCGDVWFDAEDAFIKALTIPNINNPEEIARTQMKKAEESLRIQKTSEIFDAKANGQR